MPFAHSARIHHTAVIAPEAELADDVQVGPHVVIEGAVKVGLGCVIRPGVHLIGPLTLGRGNMIFSHAVLGERPQHLHYKDEPTSVEIGDNNIFREHVTVHRGTKQSMLTRIGSNNYFMANSHVAHDCRIGNNCMLANGALVGGHCTIEDNVLMSGNSAVHQFVRVGRLALISGVSGSTKDVPPFIIVQRINRTVGINVVGMRRSGVPTDHIDAVRRAFHMLYHSENSMPNAIALIERDLGGVPEVAELVAFVRESKRGISLVTEREAA